MQSVAFAASWHAATHLASLPCKDVLGERVGGGVIVKTGRISIRRCRESAAILHHATSPLPGCPAPSRQKGATSGCGQSGLTLESVPLRAASAAMATEMPLVANHTSGPPRHCHRRPLFYDCRWTDAVLNSRAGGEMFVRSRPPISVRRAGTPALRHICSGAETQAGIRSPHPRP
jgi:hypothetical protein